MEKTNIVRISTLCLSFFLVFLLSLSANLYCALRPISFETIRRLSYESPMESNNAVWREVNEHDFPWVSPQFVTGWQRIINSSSKAGIYISIFPARTPFEPQEYKNLMYQALYEVFNVSLINQKLLTVSGYSAESFVLASSNVGNGLGFEVGNIPTTIEYVIIQLEGEPPDSYYHPAVVIIFSAPSKYFNDISKEFDVFINNFKIKSLPGTDTTTPIVTNGSPSGTIIYNQPTISVNTNRDATCRFDFNNKSYEEMAYSLSGDGKVHSYTFDEPLHDGKYTIFARAKDTSGNISSDSYSWNLTISQFVHPPKPTEQKQVALGFQSSLTDIEGSTIALNSPSWGAFFLFGGHFTNSNSINSKVNLGFGINVNLVEITSLGNSQNDDLHVQIGGLCGLTLEETKKREFFIELPLKLKYTFSNTISIWTAIGIGYSSEGDEMVIPFRDKIPLGIEIKL